MISQFTLLKELKLNQRRRAMQGLKLTLSLCLDDGRILAWGDKTR